MSDTVQLRALHPGSRFRVAEGYLAPGGSSDAGVLTIAPSHEQPRTGNRVTPAEAGVLQTFRADYPWHGKLGKQHMQAGNAIPPKLAEALLNVVTGEQTAREINLAAFGL